MPQKNSQCIDEPAIKSGFKKFISTYYRKKD